jgi:hypothetical protein
MADRGAIGAAVDASHAADAASALQWIGRTLSPGDTALITILSEPTNDALDAMAQRLDGTIVRFSASAVQTELDAFADTVDAARAAADQARREAKSAARHERWQEVKASVLAKFKRASK